MAMKKAVIDQMDSRLQFRPDAAAITGTGFRQQTYWIVAEQGVNTIEGDFFVPACRKHQIPQCIACCVIIGGVGITISIATTTISAATAAAAAEALSQQTPPELFVNDSCHLLGPKDFTGNGQRAAMKDKSE